MNKTTESGHSLLRITNVRIYGIAEAIVASKFPLLKRPYTEEEFEERVQEVQRAIETMSEEDFLAQKYAQTPSKLAKAPSGEGHDCFLKGITVCFRLEYPVFWSPQLQRYHFIDFVSSSSTMHTILNQDMYVLCEGLDVPEEMIRTLERHQYNAKYAPNLEDRTRAFQMLCSILPQGQTKVAYITTNYLQLKTILKQRKQHKLIEWREFCHQIEANCPLLVALTKGGML